MKINIRLILLSCVLIIISIISYISYSERLVSIKSIEVDKKKYILIENISNKCLNLNLIDIEVEGLFPNECTIIETNNLNINYSDVVINENYYSARLPKYDENIMINKSEKTVSLNITKFMDFEDTYDAEVIFIVYKDNNIVEILEKEFIFEDREFYIMEDIKSDFDNIKLLYRFWKKT